jgi:hypothetical protein
VLKLFRESAVKEMGLMRMNNNKIIKSNRLKFSFETLVTGQLDPTSARKK